MALEASQEYQEMFDNYIEAASIGSGYARDSEQFIEMMRQGIPAETMDGYFKSAGMTVIKNSDGSYAYIGRPTIDPPASDNALSFNSNLQTGTSGTSGGGAYSSSAFSTEGGGTASDNIKAGATKVFKDGALAAAGTKVLGVAGKAMSVVMAYNFGLNLGKWVEGALYDADPDFWDEHGMSTLDPDTWGQISSEIDNPAGRFAFNLLAGVRTPKETGKPTLTMYADENAQAYFAKWLVANGFFEEGEKEETAAYTPSTTWGGQDISLYHLPVSITEQQHFYGSFREVNPMGYNFYIKSDSVVYSVILRSGTVPNTSSTIIMVSRTPFQFTRTWGEPSNTYPDSGYENAVSKNTYNGTPFYYITTGTSGESNFMDVPTNDDADWPMLVRNDVVGWATIILDGTINTITSGGMTGVQNQNGATIFDPSSMTADSTIADYRDAIRAQFPDLYNNRIEYSVAQPDGSTKVYTYIPIPVADGFYQNTNQPVGDADTKYQGNYDYDGSNMSDTLISTLLNWLTNEKPSNLVNPNDYTGTTTPPNAPDTGNGNGPVFVPVTGKASSLYAIYNPTLAQLNSLGAWLWSSDFIDQILKLFSDPMQAIIGLHKIFATPATGAEQNIKVGYLDSGVPSKIVTDQYTTIDCGTVDCAEYFGNVFDYSPYTNIQIYLPFIGIVDLSTSDVMRSKVHVVYHVDVLSGACLAEIKVTRDNYSGTLYQYAGNASVTMPISSGSYIGVISNVVGVAARAVSGFTVGGVAGAAVGGVSGALSAHGGTQVQHSGGFSGNAGAMGIKKPYLIIERPQTEIAEKAETLQGYGSNKYVTLSECTGYTRVKAVHVDKIEKATSAEKDMIETALKNGVIFK